MSLGYIPRPGGAGGFQEQAFEFHGDTYYEHAYLTTGTDAERQSVTISVHFRRSRWTTAVSDEYLLAVQLDAGNFLNIEIHQTDYIEVNLTLGSALVGYKRGATSQMQDSDWHHLCVVFDLANVTDTERMKAFLDNVELTTTPTEPNLSTYKVPLALTGSDLTFGASDVGTQQFNGVMQDLNIVMGQALTPGDFAQDDGSGNWVQKNYSGTHGANGIQLLMTDPGDLGKNTART